MSKKNKKTVPAAKAKATPRTLRDALGVKPVRLQKVDDLDLGLAPKPKPLFPEAPSELSSIIRKPPESQFKELLKPDATEEQRNLIAAAEAAEPLLKKPEIKRLMGSMVAFRQAYAVAYRELQEILAKEGEGLHPMVEDLIVQSAMYESSKPFSEHVLMDGMVNTVLPWIADVIDAHTALDAEAERKAKIEAEEERTKTPIPIGFKHAPQQEEAVLERDRSLVLVGWQSAVLWLLDQIMTHVLLAKKPAFTIIRFMEFAPKTVGDQRLIRLPQSKWEGCCNSNKELARVMGSHVADQLTYQPDLVMCDNMPKAYTKGFFGRPGGASAGDANKHFSDWCKKAHCAFIGCVPLDTQEPPDLKAGEYEQLRTFSHLRTVTVQETGENLADDHVRIAVSDGVAVFDVPKQQLEHYGKPAIIVPGGGV